jgi:hypothetical protein
VALESILRINVLARSGISLHFRGPTLTTTEKKKGFLHSLKNL